MLIIQNKKILDLIRNEYTVEEIHEVIEFLKNKNTFDFCSLSTGLFPAALTRHETQYTGYKYVWVRDNIYVAYAHYVIGDFDVSIKCLSSLIKYFKSYRYRFEKIIENPNLANDIIQRPHVRFDGENLQEVDEKWSHAQNDALGYFLWLYCKLLNEELLKLEKEDIEIIALFPLYFDAISYWKDKDSGHWEEERKIEASSVGVVKAGLEALRQALIELPSVSSYLAYKDRLITLDFLNELIQNGTKVLHEILPYECKEPSSNVRRYDSALLFLIYPLKIIDGAIADRVLQDVIDHLQGDYGVKRYIRDSFWAADYKKKLSPQQRTIDVSDDMSYRNSLIQEGQEAQWCIFDPIISVIFGAKFKETNQDEFLKQQIFYLNRSLGQLTGEECEAGEFKCPELYYIEDNKYIPNDVTPLLWTQANLRIALKKMEESLCLYHHKTLQ
ncbi:glycoside hydrolase family 15 protein [Synechocystis sp. PCC 7509]|uniref:glycoside hydrolase family 15 protein n=1 Tax=Synechocystis sp. PCC 7509 TaxID=927677 RepID=UPI0002AC6A0D|nr:glycoside hydrolase family 15 protein [Synechocystis sp. PCC 7509]